MNDNQPIQEATDLITQPLSNCEKLVTSNQLNNDNQSKSKIEFICPFDGCELKFIKNNERKSNKVSGFRDHVKKAHPQKQIIKCKTLNCCRTFGLNNMDTALNWFIHHVGRCFEKFECNICTRTFKEKNKLTQHLKMHEYENEQETCPNCNVVIKGQMKSRYMRAYEVMELHKLDCNKKDQF